MADPYKWAITELRVQKQAFIKIFLFNKFIEAVVSLPRA